MTHPDQSKLTVVHSPYVASDGRPACTCGWKIREGWWADKNAAARRALIHAERAEAGLPA